MKSCRAYRSGFTLLETMVATVIVLGALGLALTGFMYAVRTQSFTDAQDELDLDSQVSIERLKRDLRLSSLSEILYWPQAAASYTAMSFPLAYDDDGDGSIEVDSNSKIIWDETVIYHMWMNMPEPSELRVTRFRPRCQTITQAERQRQLDEVVSRGRGAGCERGAERATTETIFLNLFDWEIKPKGGRFDGRHPTLACSPMIDLGSYVMTPGSHTISFRAIITNVPSSNPYAYCANFCIGLDTLKITPCSMQREAETMLTTTNPVTYAYPSTFTPAPALQEEVIEVKSGSLRREEVGGNLAWSGNQHLLFVPTYASGNSYTGFSIRIQNDLWNEYKFYSADAAMSETVVSYETNLPPYITRKFVVKLRDSATNWTATAQSADASGYGAASNAFRGAAIRVLIKGSDMGDGGNISGSGGRCLVGLRAGEAQFTVDKMWIAECSRSDVPSMDAKLGMMVALTNSMTVPSGTVVETPEWGNFQIDRKKTYMVTMKVKNEGAHGSPHCWVHPSGVAVTNSYIIWGDYNPSESLASFPVWSTLPTNYPVTPSHLVIGVDHIRTTCAPTGTYVSAVCDTGELAPAFTNWALSVARPGIGNVELRIRSASRSDMLDAPDWYDSTRVVSGTASWSSDLTIGSLTGLPSKRYTQFMLTMSPDLTTTNSPMVREVKMAWSGQSQIVDIGGQFTMGPDYGVWEITVDGTNVLKSGIQIDAVLYKYLRGFRNKGEQRVVSPVSIEVTPRNSGK